VTKNILVQYRDLKQEAKDLRRRIDATRRQLLALENGGTVFDTVRGTRKDGTIGGIRVEGFPDREYRYRQAALRRYLERLENTEARLLSLLEEAEGVIDQIPDSFMRRIVRLRVMDDLSWQQVARAMGGGNTADSVRKAFDRFFAEI